MQRRKGESENSDEEMFAAASELEVIERVGRELQRLAEFQASSAC